MSKTNPKVHSLAGAPKPPTEEEIKQQRIRALHQQRCGMAQAFAANICNSTPYDILKEYGTKDVAAWAASLADEMMAQFYGVKEEPKEAAEDEA